MRLALEEIEPEDRTRTEVLGARVVLYIAAKKWDMAAAVASHLVKVEPGNEVLYTLAPSDRTRASRAAWKRRKFACGMPSSLIKTFVDWRLTMKISARCGIGSLAWSKF